MKRRDFFRKTVLGSGLTLTGLMALPSCTTSPKDSDPERNPTAENASDKNYRIRYEANSKEAVPHMVAYENAIEIMKKNPQILNDNKELGNGLNWMRQAQIHLDHCPHGSWAFFPWHREYLFRFEEIIRAVSGYEEFALPYWDWSSNFNLPPLCRDKEQSFFMDEVSRVTDISKLVEAQTNLNIVKKSLAVKDFIAFMGSGDGSGEVEYGPHNGVHVALGGTMGTFTSPLDPVFWMHHCNVDRLWAIWQEANPQWINVEEIQDKFPKFLSVKLYGFYNRQGQAIRKSRLAKDLLDTFAEPLRYCYPETQPDSTGNRSAPRMPAAEKRTKLKVRAFNRDKIKFQLTKLANSDAYQLRLPEFKGNVGKMLDDYLVDAHRFENFYFRLRTEKFPKLAGGTSMKISLMVDGANDIFITNYSFFSSTMEQMKIVGLQPLETAAQGEHHNHNESHNTDEDAPKPKNIHAHHIAKTIPKFYFDFEKVLRELRNKGIAIYPEPTNFKIEFLSTATKVSHVLDPKIFADVDFKLVVLERVSINLASDDSDAENDK